MAKFGEIGMKPSFDSNIGLEAIGFDIGMLASGTFPIWTHYNYNAADSNRNESPCTTQGIILSSGNLRLSDNGYSFLWLNPVNMFLSNGSALYIINREFVIKMASITVVEKYKDVFWPIRYACMDANHIYLADDHGRVTCLSADTLITKWQRTDVSALAPFVKVIGNYVILYSDNSSNLVSTVTLDKDTGDTLYSLYGNNQTNSYGLNMQTYLSAAASVIERSSAVLSPLDTQYVEGTVANDKIYIATAAAVTGGNTNVCPGMRSAATPFILQIYNLLGGLIWEGRKWSNFTHSMSDFVAENPDYWAPPMPGAQGKCPGTSVSNVTWYNQEMSLRATTGRTSLDNMSPFAGDTYGYDKDGGYTVAFQFTGSTIFRFYERLDPPNSVNTKVSMAIYGVNGGKLADYYDFPVNYAVAFGNKLGYTDNVALFTLKEAYGGGRHLLVSMTSGGQLGSIGNVVLPYTTINRFILNKNEIIVSGGSYVAAYNISTLTQKWELNLTTILGLYQIKAQITGNNQVYVTGTDIYNDPYYVLIA